VHHADNSQLMWPRYSAQWDLTYLPRTVYQFGPRATLMQFREDLPSQPGPNINTEVSSSFRVLPDQGFQVLILGRAAGVMTWVKAE